MIPITLSLQPMKTVDHRLNVAQNAIPVNDQQEGVFGWSHSKGDHRSWVVWVLPPSLTAAEERDIHPVCPSAVSQLTMLHLLKLIFLHCVSEIILLEESCHGTGSLGTLFHHSPTLNTQELSFFLVPQQWWVHVTRQDREGLLMWPI